MHWKEPKDTDTHVWTAHSKMKMRFYGLSEQRIRSVVRRPERVQEGVAEKTVAVMQPQSKRRDKETGEKTWSAEIWVMYQIFQGTQKKVDIDVPEKLKGIFAPQKKVRVISAWRYPGKTNPEEELPDAILDEIAEVI